MAIQTVEYQINGQTYQIPIDSGSGKYKRTINAPGTTSWGETDHKYASQLKITDTAGNVTTINKDDPTFGDKMMIRVLLDKLSVEEREIIILHVEEGLTFKEISEIMEMKLTTVLNKYHRSLKKLKKSLEE